jgi:hypothetical protein
MASAAYQSLQQSFSGASSLIQQVADETDEERRRRILAAQQQRLLPGSAAGRQLGLSTVGYSAALGG